MLPLETSLDFHVRLKKEPHWTVQAAPKVRPRSRGGLELMKPTRFLDDPTDRQPDPNPKGPKYQSMEYLYMVSVLGIVIIVLGIHFIQ